jgi:DNA-binding NtrC family response regulator
MKTSVLVVNAVKKESDSMADLLRAAGYLPYCVDHLQDAPAAIAAKACTAVLLDLDSIQVSNRAVRDISLQFPRVCFLGTSWQPMHPELKDAISHHIYACIQKPIDREELVYWLKSGRR